MATELPPITVTEPTPKPGPTPKPKSILSYLSPNPSSYPANAIPASILESHLVSRPQFVRIDPSTGQVTETVTMVVGGQVFEDWETVWIQWSWAEPFSVFRFTCAEREPYPAAGQVLQFAPGNTVDIYLGGIQVINGVIISRQVAYDAGQHMVQLQGVSGSWFANRSGIDHPTSDFSGKTFLQIADELLKPTGIKYQIVGEIDSTPFDAGMSNSPSESIGQVFERLARNRKIIVSNMPNGDFLFIGQHQWQPMGELIEGVNIKKMQCVISIEGARSEFISRAQKAAHDSSHGRAASEQEARLKGIMAPYSILVTSMEHPVWSAAEVMTRTQNEKMWNESMTVIDAAVTVYGWFRPLPTDVVSWATQNLGSSKRRGHTLWQAGDEVIVHSPMAMLYDQALKIRTVTWTQDSSNGSQTLLNLCLPSGLNGIPVPRSKITPGITLAPIVEPF